MKKTFPLTSERLAPARVRDKIRQELNRYSRRQHHRRPPEGFTLWNFVCKIGPNATAVEVRPFNELGAVVDRLAESGATEVYIEISAQPGTR
ncbi:MAG: DUF6172 family protein [Opitutaceae bacterium]|nr:DUF6172 family protein [Opitutaceae bacterium]